MLFGIKQRHRNPRMGSTGDHWLTGAILARDLIGGRVLPAVPANAISSTTTEGAFVLQVGGLR